MLRNLSIALLLCAPISTHAAEKPAPLPIKTKIIGAQQCVMTHQAAAGNKAILPLIASILVPIVADFAIDAISAELKRVRTKKQSATLPFDLYTLTVPGKRFPDSRQPQCITIVTGQFADADGELRATAVDTSVPLPPQATVDQVAARLRANGYDLGSNLNAILEVQMEPSADGTAFRYKPVYYRAFQLLPGQSAKKQGVIYTISMVGPGGTPDGTAYSAATISLGEVSDGLELYAGVGDDTANKRLAGASTGLLSAPGLTTASYRAYQRLRADAPVTCPAPPDRAAPPCPMTHYLMPVVLKADLVQTQKPSDAALLIAKLLDSSKAKIVEKIGAEVAVEDPFKRDQAKLDAKIAVETAQVELDTAREVSGISDTARANRVALATTKLEKAKAALAELETN